MITGEQIREQTIVTPQVNYRKLSALNCSMLKLFDSDPVKFFEQFKLGKGRRDDKKSVSLILGDLVDFFLLDCKGDEEVFNNRFDEKFALFTGTKGSGQVFTLADELFKVTQDSLNDEGVITTSFDVRFTEAFTKVQAMGKYKGGTEEKALKDFTDNGYSYFQALLDNIGKTVIDITLLDKSKKISTLLLEDPFTKDIFDNEMEYLPKFPIEWYYTTSMKKVKCKSEVDILLIDHKHKIIYLKDLKTTYDNEEFEYTYLKYQYYLQAAFYYLAVTEWAKEEGLEGYTITPMEFVVGDTSSNNRRPIKYQTNKSDLDKGLNGFSINGKRYRGVHEIMDEINWAEDNNIWNASKTLIKQDGVLKLNLRYD